MQARKIFTNTLLLGLIFTAACVQVGDQDSGSDSNSVQTDSASQPHILNGTLSEKNQIDDTKNTYDIASATPPSFAVDLNMPDGFTTLQKLDHSQKLLWQKNPQPHFYDGDLEPGEVYTYQIGNIVGGTFVVTDSWTIDVPYDLIVSGTIDLPSIPAYKLVKIRYLVFANEDSTLTIESTSLTIHANELLSSHGLITSYTGQNAVADWEKNGANSGSLTLSANKFVGQLRIYLDGQRGGPWFDTGQHAPTGGLAGTPRQQLPANSDVDAHGNAGLLGELRPTP